MRQVSAELDIKGKYLRFEDRTLREIQEHIEESDESEGLRKGTFTILLDKISRHNA